MRGGHREGSGRPRQEPTIQIRVPESLVFRVQGLITCYKNQTPEPAAVSEWQPLSSLPESGRRVDLWCVEGAKSGCLYDINSGMFSADCRRKAFWVAKVTAWRYSAPVLPPSFD